MTTKSKEMMDASIFTLILKQLVPSLPLLFTVNLPTLSTLSATILLSLNKSHCKPLNVLFNIMFLELLCHTFLH